MVDYFSEKQASVASNKPMFKYMLSYLDIITTVSSILLIRIGTEEALEKKKEILAYIRQKDKKDVQKTALRSSGKLYESARKDRSLDICGRL